MNVGIQSEVICLFLIVLVGFAAKRMGVIKDQMEQGISDLILNVSIPALLIVSLYDADIPSDFGFIMKMMAEVFGVYVFMIAFALLSVRIFPCGDDKRRLMSFLMIFGNVGNLGYPIIASIHGSLGVMYATMFNLMFNLVLWTVGVWILGSKMMGFSWRKMCTPGLISIVIGYIVFLLPIPLPLPVYLALGKIGAMVSPLAMLLIGVTLSGQRLKDFFKSRLVWGFLGMRQIVMPLVLLFIIRLFGGNQESGSVVTVLASMPVAVNLVAFARTYGADYDFAAQAVVLTTITSLTLLPLLLRVAG